jgi:hypothetical protein
VSNTPESSPTREYLDLLDLAYDVAQAIKGRKTADRRLPACQQLATKLYMHAASIYWLSQGTRAPVPRALSTGTDFCDFPSIAVLTRAILETYLNLYEVFFEPVSEDEREFRYQIWLLSGFAVREMHRPSDPVSASQVAQSRAENQEIRRKLSHTGKFKRSSKKAQESLLKGKRPRRNWTVVAKAAGFGEKTIRLMYAYYSGYAHADGLAGAQIVAANTRAQQIEFTELHMRTTMMVLSKMILDYRGAFRESKRACDAKPNAFSRAEIWVAVAERLQ